MSRTKDPKTNQQPTSRKKSLLVGSASEKPDGKVDKTKDDTSVSYSPKTPAHALDSTSDEKRDNVNQTSEPSTPITKTTSPSSLTTDTSSDDESSSPGTPVTKTDAVNEAFNGQGTNPPSTSSTPVADKSTVDAVLKQSTSQPSSTGSTPVADKSTVDDLLKQSTSQPSSTGSTPVADKSTVDEAMNGNTQQNHINSSPPSPYATPPKSTENKNLFIAMQTPTGMTPVSFKRSGTKPSEYFSKDNGFKFDSVVQSLFQNSPSGYQLLQNEVFASPSKQEALAKSVKLEGILNDTFKNIEEQLKDFENSDDFQAHPSTPSSKGSQQTPRKTPEQTTRTTTTTSSTSTARPTHNPETTVPATTTTAGSRSKPGTRKTRTNHNGQLKSSPLHKPKTKNEPAAPIEPGYEMLAGFRHIYTFINRVVNVAIAVPLNMVFYFLYSAAEQVNSLHWSNALIINKFMHREEIHENDDEKLIPDSDDPLNEEERLEATLNAERKIKDDTKIGKTIGWRAFGVLLFILNSVGRILAMPFAAAFQTLFGFWHGLQEGWGKKWDENKPLLAALALPVDHVNAAHQKTPAPSDKPATYYTHEKGSRVVKQSTPMNQEKREKERVDARQRPIFRLRGYEDVPKAGLKKSFYFNPWHLVTLTAIAGLWTAAICTGIIGLAPVVPVLAPAATALLGWMNAAFAFVGLSLAGLSTAATTALAFAFTGVVSAVATGVAELALAAVAYMLKGIAALDKIVEDKVADAAKYIASPRHVYMVLGDEVEMVQPSTIEPHNNGQPFTYSKLNLNSKTTNQGANTSSTLENQNQKEPKA